MKGNDSQLVIFRLSDIEFGIPVSEVQEIVRPSAFTRVPLTPPHILGLVNLRGSILPVVDARIRLGLKASEVDERSRLLVVDLNGSRVGFLVDEVREVRSFSEDMLEPPPETAREVEGFVTHVVKFDRGERVVFLLEVSRLVGSVERSAAAAASGFAVELEKGSSEVRRVEEVRILSFDLGEEEYGFKIESVREIIRFKTPKAIPEAPSYVKGLLTLREHVIPVFDLRAIVGLEPLAEERRRRLAHLKEFFRNVLRKVEEKGEEAIPPAENCMLGSWIEERLSASRNEREFSLLYALAQLHERFHETAKRLSEGPGYLEELKRTGEEILKGLDALEGVVEESLAEEQRIIVLEFQSRVFGLLVDRVEEVLAVPKEAIDDPPSGEKDLLGIVKLDSGRRLVFLLNEAEVVPVEDLEEYAQEGGAEMSEERREDVEELQLITFNLGEEEYGIPIVQIQEINRLGRITRVPNTPEFIEGVTNLRGEVIPVIDLRKRFGIAPRERDDRTRLIIVQLAGKKTGLIVDWVNEVARLSKDQIEPPPKMLESQVDLKFISGIAKAGPERMILILDVEEILSSEEKKALGELEVEERGLDEMKIAE